MAAHEVGRRGLRGVGLGMAMSAVFAAGPALATPPLDGVPKATQATTQAAVTAQTTATQPATPMTAQGSQSAGMVKPAAKEAASPAKPGTTTGGPLNMGIGGHVGVSVPFVTVQGYTTSTYPANSIPRTQNVSDQFNLAIPVGVTLKPTKRLWIDFEFIVSTAVQPAGQTVFTVDPGVIYNWGPLSTGLRVAVPVGAAPVAIGVIPLISRNIVNVGPAVWFVEADFPTIYHGSAAPVVATRTQGINSRVEFNAVLHTGFGF